MSDPFERACAAFNAANARDPRNIDDDGAERPYQLVHAERVTAWVERLVPDASEALRLAARCQHLERWTIPRTDFAAGRDGYLKWRRTLARFHADRAEAILQDVGYDPATIERVRRIVLKQGIKRDGEVQAIEDALCLAFLEHEASDFASRHEPDKVVVILKRTWVKMSAEGHAMALALPLPSDVRSALEAAIAE